MEIVGQRDSAEPTEVRTRRGKKIFGILTRFRIVCLSFISLPKLSLMHSTVEAA
jgi:hypothetical protein